MFCDPGLLRSLPQNLVGNAWKFTGQREDAHIRIEVERAPAQTVLTVSDNGAGFDDSGIGVRLRPFQRFHAQSQRQDTGVGLVTCQRIAQRHGGCLQITPTPGTGTRVAVALPLGSPGG